MDDDSPIVHKLISFTQGGSGGNEEFLPGGSGVGKCIGAMCFSVAIFYPLSITSRSYPSIPILAQPNMSFSELFPAYRVFCTLSISPTHIQLR